MTPSVVFYNSRPNRRRHSGFTVSIICSEDLHQSYNPLTKHLVDVNGWSKSKGCGDRQAAHKKSTFWWFRKPQKQLQQKEISAQGHCFFWPDFSNKFSTFSVFTFTPPSSLYCMQHRHFSTEEDSPVITKSQAKSKSLVAPKPRSNQHSYYSIFLKFFLPGSVLILFL